MFAATAALHTPLSGQLAGRDAMTSFAALWLPILVSAVFVFLLSSVFHMLSPWHKSDYPAVPNEAGVMDAIRPFAIPPGEYMVPRPVGRDAMKDPQFLERLNRGPVFILTMRPNGMISFGRSMGLWFAYLIVVTGISGHIAQGAGVSPTDGQRLFHTVALTAFMGYVAALWQMTIWYQRPWISSLKATVDGLVYAIVTGLVFVWLWPK
jgi:hypothetical protein